MYIHIYICMYVYIYIYIYYLRTPYLSVQYVCIETGDTLCIYIYMYIYMHGSCVSWPLGMVHDDYIWLHSGGGWWLIASQHRFHYASRMLHLYILCGLIIRAKLQKNMFGFCIRKQLIKERSFRNWGQFWPGVLYSWESWSLAKDSGEVTR